MDLSFTLNPREGDRGPKWAASMADIVAAADARQLMSAERGATIVAASVKEVEIADILTCLTAKPSLDSGITRVGGSFNPLIANKLRVGQ